MQHLLFLQAVSRRYVNLHNASYDWEREKGRERERERERAEVQYWCRFRNRRFKSFGLTSTF